MWSDIEDHVPSKPSFGQQNINQSFTGKKPFKPWQNKNPEPITDDVYLPVAFAVSKDAPESLLPLIKQIAELLNDRKYTIRIGGNKDFDEYFEKEALKKEIHLPWRGFNEKESKLTFNSDQAMHLAKLHSPVFDTLPNAVKAIITRNVRVMLGKDLKSPALFTIIWSPDGCEHNKNRSIKTGNVGILVSLSSLLRIPVFNLANPNAMERLTSYLNS